MTSRSLAFASNSAGVSYPVTPTSFGPHHDDGHTVVHQRDVDPLDRVHRVARRQERAARRPGRILEVEPDRRRRAGYTGDRTVTVIRRHRRRAAGRAPPRCHPC